MAKVLIGKDDVKHLRGTNSTLCGETDISPNESDGTLTCKVCADIALRAVELVTKAEKREWRKL